MLNQHRSEKAKEQHRGDGCKSGRVKTENDS